MASSASSATRRSGSLGTPRDLLDGLRRDVPEAAATFGLSTQTLSQPTSNSVPRRRCSTVTDGVAGTASHTVTGEVAVLHQLTNMKAELATTHTNPLL